MPTLRTIPPKTAITLFDHLSSRHDSSRSHDYRVARYFLDKGRLGKVICITYDKRIKISRTYVKSLAVIAKIIFRLVRFLKLVLPAVPDTLAQEWIFDIFCTYRLKRECCDLLLNLRPVTPIAIKSFKRATRNRKTTIVTLATIAHPKFNYSIVKKMQNIYHLPNRSPYTDWGRVKRLDEAFRHSDMVVLTVDSEFILNTYKSYGIPDSKIITLRDNSHGLNTRFFVPRRARLNNGPVKFLTLGFLSLIKGIPLLLEAWDKLNRDHELNAKLLIAGKMDKDIKTIMARRQWGNSDTIKVLGYVEDLVATYQMADIFIASSVSDNGPATVLEAMACGLPVIASSHCGFAKYVENGKEGFVYDPFDIETLKKLILWFVKNRSKIPSMGRHARKRILNLEAGDYPAYIYLACFPELEAQFPSGPK